MRFALALITFITSLAVEAAPLTIRAARMFDGLSARRNVIVTVDGGRITSVEAAATRAVEIDLGDDVTLLPRVPRPRGGDGDHRRCRKL